MKTVLLCLPVLATTLYAQPIPDVEIIAKITYDLLPLKSALIASEPLEDNVYGPAELQSLVTYSQSKAIQSYRKDLIAFEFKHTSMVRRPEDARLGFTPFFSPDQAYKLTSALAGKDLTEENLTPLVEGIVGMVESAVQCRNTSTQLQNSAAFRGSAEKVWYALRV